MSQALYRKWRPHRWEQVIGQQHIVQTLRNAVAAQRVGHAYLFAGPRGTGKTTTARLLAKAVNCLDGDLASRPCDHCEFCEAVNQSRFLDLIEIDAASNTSVEDVRDLRDKINFRPNQAPFKVYIIDEVHMLSTAAFNALLKTLEEPPPHAIFILATTEIHKIPATVLSRCQRHEFRRVPVQELIAHLKAIVAAENLDVSEEALSLVARQATGSVRDAISLLDQLASTGQPVSLDLAQTVLGTATNQAILDLVEAMVAERADAGLDHLHRALDGGSDPRQFARQVVDYLRGLLLVRMSNASLLDVTAEMRAHMARHSQMFMVEELLEIIRGFNQAANDARSAWQPALPLELALIDGLKIKSKTVEPVQPPSSGGGVRSQQPAVKIAHPTGSAAALPEAKDEPPGDAGSQAIIKAINENWRQILAQINRQGPNTAALLRSSRLLGVKDGVVYFGFSSELLKSKMEKSENLELVAQAISQALHTDVSLRCVVAGGKSSALPPEVDSDGMVASALRDLGGEIVDIQ
jgi:DNA polymerase-3 subunit gamma/tau